MSKIDIKIPSVGESVSNAIVNKINDAEFVKKGECIIELETDKISVEIEAEESGKIFLQCKIGDVCNVGDVIGYIDTSISINHESNKNNDKLDNEDKHDVISNNEEKFHEPSIGIEELLRFVDNNSPSNELAISPEIDILLKKYNIDPIIIKGTGPKNRIIKSDILEYVNAKSNQIEIIEPFKSSIISPDIIHDSSNFSILSSKRKAIKNNLINAKNAKVHTTTFNEINMDNIFEYMKKSKISPTSLFIKLSNITLNQFKNFASYIEDDKQIFTDTSKISFAYAVTGGGVLTPTIYDCNKKSILQIEKEIKDIANGIIENKWKGDLSGGAMTVTNGGKFGSMLSTPMIPYMTQSCILGVHNIEKRPICKTIDNEDKISIGNMMYIALTYDHALIDGKDAVEFLMHIKKCIENPEFFMMHSI